MTRARQLAAASTLLIVAAVISVGCGGSDESSDGDRSSSKPVKVQEPTAPKADADLTKQLGEQGTALTDAGCVFGVFEEEEADHEEDASKLTWKSFPPTSGQHHPEWAPFGLYDENVTDGYATHNLEHGGVNVWLGTEVDDATRDAVAELLDDGEKWLVAPREDLEGLYSAAWTKGLSCPPEALEQLGADATAAALNAWYGVVNSTGSEAEKSIPAYAGAMKEPTPEQDISEPAPF